MAGVRVTGMHWLSWKILGVRQRWSNTLWTVEENRVESVNSCGHIADIIMLGKWIQENDAKKQNTVGLYHLYS